MGAYQKSRSVLSGDRFQSHTEIFFLILEEVNNPPHRYVYGKDSRASLTAHISTSNLKLRLIFRVNNQTERLPKAFTIYP